MTRLRIWTISEKPTSSKRFARRNEARAVADKLMRPPGLKRVDRKRRDYSLRDLQRPFADLNRPLSGADSSYSRVNRPPSGAAETPSGADEPWSGAEEPR